MKLSDFTQGRDNNFNCIRMVAAFSVLVSHSFTLASRYDMRFGVIGSIAVDVFFITSGFLVTTSLFTRQNVIEFVWARVLRIFPALWVMLFITVFCVGACITTFSLSSYFTDPMTYLYLLKNGTLIAGMRHFLPGVFCGNPFGREVNGSLWTLPCELRCYALLAIIWIVLSINRRCREQAFRFGVVTCTGLLGVYVLYSQFFNLCPSPMFRWYFMFFTGACFFFYKEHIALSRIVFWLIVIVLLFASQNKCALYVAYILSIAYMVFFVAYVPSGIIRKYNRLGDYSYGVYIYAFPVQQTIAALVPGVSGLSMLFYSAPAASILAVLSWHFVERHALGLKTVVEGHTRRMLASGQSRLFPRRRKSEGSA